MGAWLTATKVGAIRIAPCADPARGPVCGTIVKLIDPKGPDGVVVAPEVATDYRHADRKLRSRKVTGMVLLYGFINTTDPEHLRRWHDLQRRERPGPITPTSACSPTARCACAAMSARRCWARRRFGQRSGRLGKRNMDAGIKGRKAIVCAASQGLGKGCAIALAQGGRQSGDQRPHASPSLRRPRRRSAEDRRGGHGRRGRRDDRGGAQGGARRLPGTRHPDQQCGRPADRRLPRLGHAMPGSRRSTPTCSRRSSSSRPPSTA